MPDVKWGIAWALAFATGFSAWVLLLTLLRGSASFDEHGTTAWRIIGSYYATAVVAGTLLGLWRPYTRTRAGAIAVGCLVGTAVYAGVGIGMEGVSRSTILFGAVIGIPMGGFLGNREWKQNNRASSEPAT